MTMVPARQLRLLLPLSRPETSLRNQRLFHATVYDSATRGFQRRDHPQSVRPVGTAACRFRQKKTPPPPPKGDRGRLPGTDEVQFLPPTPPPPRACFSGINKK